MAEFYCYEGIRNGATFKVADDTKTALAGKITDIVGKVVTLTGNYEVGYGSADDVPLGFVEQVEYENTNSDTLVVSVVFNEAREDIACEGSENAGDFLACDGKGGVKQSTTATSAKAYGVDASANTATVYIHG